MLNHSENSNYILNSCMHSLYSTCIMYSTCSAEMDRAPSPDREHCIEITISDPWTYMRFHQEDECTEAQLVRPVYQRCDEMKGRAPRHGRLYWRPSHSSKYICVHAHACMLVCNTSLKCVQTKKIHAAVCSYIPIHVKAARLRTYTYLIKFRHSAFQSCAPWKKTKLLLRL